MFGDVCPSYCDVFVCSVWRSMSKLLWCFYLQCLARCVQVTVMFLFAVFGEVCPSYCDAKSNYQSSLDCWTNGLCCGTASNMYCCVSYFDRIPPGLENVSPQDCQPPKDGATTLQPSYITTLWVIPANIRDNTLMIALGTGDLEWGRGCHSLHETQMIGIV